MPSASHTPARVRRAGHHVGQAGTGGRNYCGNLLRKLVILLSIAAIIAPALATGAPAETRPPVKVGFIFSETGPEADDAQSLMLGFEYFQKAKNSNGLKFEIIKKDAGPQNEKVSEGLADLLEKDVRFIVAPPSVKGTEPAVEAMKSGKAILFVPDQAVRLVGGEICLPSTFRLGPNNYQAAHPLGPWAFENSGAKVYITGADTPTDNEEADFFALGYERSGGSFVDRSMIPDASAIAKTLETIKQSGAQVVFASLKGPLAQSFLKEYHKAGITLPLVGPESLTGFSKVSSLSDKELRNVRTLSTIKRVQEFATGLKQKTRKEAASVGRAVDGYELGVILTYLNKDKNAAGATVDQMIESLEKIDQPGPRGKIVYDKNHERILDTFVQQFDKTGAGVTQRVVKDLGQCLSPDFGCGKIGFPKKPEPEVKDEEPFWEDHE
jgi:ABC-type branched-subunit amino acid transport system substrate-binding protein